MTINGDESFGFNMDYSIPQTISGNRIFSILGGSVGIGTTSPDAPLTVGSSSIDGSIFAYGNMGSGAFANGTGTQMMWYPRKAAFRAGFEGGQQWDDVNIGIGSTAFGYNTTASSDYSTAFGYNTTASGFFSTAFGDSTTASSDYSTAFGYFTNASGNYSTAFGDSTTASGFASTAFGSSTTASNDFSTAFGSSSTASGFASTAFGYNTTVSGDYSFGINLNNTSQTISANNVMAIMGGKVGIDSVNPEFDLTLGDISDINADGGIMAIGTFGSGATLSTTGVGSRMFWYPRKAAFRAGYASVDEFDDINIGDFSIALGQGPLANNTDSIALGSQVYATGLGSIVIGGSGSIAASQSVAIGYNANAFGRFSVSFGGSAPSYASGYASFVFGDNSRTGYVPDNFSLNNPGDVILIIPGDASNRFQVNDLVNIYVNNPSIVPSVQRQVQNVFFNGVDTEITIDQNINGFSIGGLVSSQAFGVNAFAGGSASQALGESSFAFGASSLAEGVRSVALGDQAVASGYGSVALSGMNYAIGQYSLAGGNNSYATGTNAISLGSNNTASGANSLSLGTQMEVSGDNSVGINLFSSNSQTLSQSNTLAIMGGNVGIGNLAPSVPLSVVGDAEINGNLVIANLLTMPNIPAYDDDTAAGSLPAGRVYQTTGAGAPPLNVPGILMIKQ